MHSMQQQKNPTLIVLPLKTLEEQWFDAVQRYVTLYKREQDRKSAEIKNRTNNMNLKKEENTISISINEFKNIQHEPDKSENILVKTMSARNFILKEQKKSIDISPISLKHVIGKNLKESFRKWVYTPRKCFEDQFQFCSIVVLLLLICLAILWLMLIGFRKRGNM